MQTTTLDTTDDTIYVRGIMDRVEELEADMPDDASVRNWDGLPELMKLSAILDKLAGEGGDEHWRGAWHPQYLIKDSYFEQYMDELLVDCGDLPKDLPAYLRVVIDYDMLRTDYTPIEIDGVTYWYR